MRLFGFEITRESKTSGSIDLNTLIARLDAIYELASGVAINPDIAMRAPTVQAVVQAISRRISTLPVHVYRKTTTGNGRTSKELLADHPVTRLLTKPTEWLTDLSYWQDATSWLVRYGNFYAFKAQGRTGPVRRLLPLHPNAVHIHQDPSTMEVTYRVTFTNGTHQEYSPAQIHHARGPARDGLRGDSPVMDVAEAIALEIASEKYGAAFFGNGAMPGLVFQHAAGSQGFKTDEERKKFVDNLTAVYAKKGRHKPLVLPKGMELSDPIVIDNDKAQFLATRQYQRTVIAGAFGVPPHLVGDLSKGTFNNVEQQSLAFIVNVVLPYVRIFEAAMERDLLTDADRSGGIIIRFNLEGALRGDFKTRQEGLKIQREMGVINANEWREQEGLNPISEEDGGETYWVKGPSGQGEEPASDDEPATSTEPSEDEDEGERSQLRAVA